MRPSSLRGRLRWLIIGVMAALLLLLGFLSINHTIGEIDELLDGRLARDARTLEVLIHAPAIESLSRDSSAPVLVPVIGNAVATRAGRQHTHESEVGFQIVDDAGHVRLATTNFAQPMPGQMLDEGFNDIHIGKRRWRVFSHQDSHDHVLIRVGERYDSRRDIERTLWFEHGLALLLGIPLLALLVGWAVKHGLAPLSRLAQMLSERQPGSREPVRLENPPSELQPLLAALNEQLHGLENALERERRFSADVAHELRTPLASILINIEHAMSAPEEAESRRALEGAQHGVGVLTRRVEQLLALARLQSDDASREAASVDLVAIAVEVIEGLSSLLDRSGVEMGFDTSAPKILLRGHEAALSAMLRNLLENAMRHVPAGGQVELSISQTSSQILIDVVDDGPGIPAERRDEVFTRFHREASSRGDGYGLGLSIVARAAQLHDASIELLDAPSGRGLRVHVAIPLDGPGS